MARLSTRLCSLLTDKVIEDLKTIEIITGLFNILLYNYYIMIDLYYIVDNFITAVHSGRIFSCQLLSLSEQVIHLYIIVID